MKNVFDLIALSRFIDDYRKKECLRIAGETANHNENYLSQVDSYDISFINNSYMLDLAVKHITEAESPWSIYEYLCNTLYYRLEKIDEEVKNYLADTLIEDDYEDIANLIQEKHEIRQLIRVIKMQLFPSRDVLLLSRSTSYDFKKDFDLNPRICSNDDYEECLPLNYKKSFDWKFLPALCKTYILPRRKISRTIFMQLKTYGINSRFYVFSPDAFNLLKSKCKVLKEENNLIILYEEDKYNYFVFKKDDNFFMLIGFFNENPEYDTIAFVLNTDVANIINDLPTSRKIVFTGSYYLTPKNLIYVE